MLGIRIILLNLLCLISTFALPNTLSDIKVINNNTTGTIKLRFDSNPICSFFLSHYDSHIIVFDIKHIRLVKGLPIIFSKKNIIQRIYKIPLKNKRNVRLAFKINQSIKSINLKILRDKNKQYNIIFTIYNMQHIKPYVKSISSMKSHYNRHYDHFFDKHRSVNMKNMTTFSKAKIKENKAIIVAIDAGHGGQDPGASSHNGLHEKNVTIKIARKLKELMDKDPMFHPFLTRKGDYFISVTNRSEVARKRKANLLISIHADAALNCLASGASVWVLSNRRARSEMAHWLEKAKKQSKLLGGTGYLLAKNKKDLYLRQTVLDLQFSYSQRVEYDIAINVLEQLCKVIPLHKRLPEHASFGVLRSLDIPSILVETGFISNLKEERLLNNSQYQYKIALYIYKGLRNYFLKHSFSSIQNHKKMLMVK